MMMMMVRMFILTFQGTVVARCPFPQRQQQEQQRKKKFNKKGSSRARILNVLKRLDRKKILIE